MVPIKRKYRLLICCLLINSALAAQQTNQPYDSVPDLMQREGFMPEEIPDKNEKPALNIRTLSADTLNELRRQKDFAYMNYIDSVLRARQAEAIADTQRKSTKQEADPKWLRFFLWTISMAGLLFVVYQVGIRRRNLFQKNPSLAKNEATNAVPTGTNELDRLISNAIQQKNYRQATRYLFIDVLHNLADKGHLQLMAEKTNYQYLREIADDSLRNAFVPLMMHYEYTWYGEFMPDEQQFASILQSFQKFRSTWL